MMALFPEGVDLSKASNEPWYARSAKDATAALGETGRERILAHFRKIFSR